MIEKLLFDDSKLSYTSTDSIAFKFIERLGNGNGDISKGLITNVGKETNGFLKTSLSVLKKLSEVNYNEPLLAKKTGPAVAPKPNFLLQYATNNTLIIQLLAPVIPFKLNGGKFIPAALLVSSAKTGEDDDDEESSIFSSSTDTKSKDDKLTLPPSVSVNVSEEAKLDDKDSESGNATSKRNSKSTTSSFKKLVDSQSLSVDSSRRSKRTLRQNQFISRDDFQLSKRNVNSYSCDVCDRLVAMRALTCCSTYVCFDCYEQYTCSIHGGAK